MKKNITNKSIIFNLLKFIVVLFVPNVNWNKRFLLLSTFFFICFLEQKITKKSRSICYLLISIILILISLYFYIYK